MHIIDIDNTDNYKCDELLHKWRQEALNFSTIHNKYCKEYSLKSKVLTFLSVFLSSAVGVSSFIQKEEWASATLGSISLVSAMLQSLTKYLKFESLETQHKQLSIKYYTLADEILYNLSEKSEEELKVVLTNVKFKLENLLKVSPNGIN